MAIGGQATTADISSKASKLWLGLLQESCHYSPSQLLALLPWSIPGQMLARVLTD